MATPTSDVRRNPYVGPRTFGYADREIYFGRETEAMNLLGRVVSERLLLFYAQSGAGKSSLINARLIPQLRKQEGFSVLPVGRVAGHLPSGVDQVDNIYLFNLMSSLIQDKSNPAQWAHLRLSNFLEHLITDDGEVWRYDPEDTAAEEESNPSENTEPGTHFALVIDQFEEIITSHPDRWPEREEFFRQLNAALQADPDLWVVLTLREDYVAALDPYASLLFNRLRARFYMERMGVSAALDAVRRPADLGGRPFAPGVAEQLVDDLRQVRVSGQTATIAGQYVEPVQLQVVCYQLWSNLEKLPLGPITAGHLLDVGDVNQALIKFYEEVLASVLASSEVPITERQLRTWFEQELITPDRTRGLIRQGEEKTGNLPNAIVAEIQKRFLLRSDARSGDTRIELVHDRFIKPILTSNQVWRDQNQNRLVHAAKAWQAQNKNPRWLLFSDELRTAKTEFAAANNELNEEERGKVEALLKESEDQERQRNNLLLALQAARLEPQKYISEMGWGVIFPSILPSEAEKLKEIEAIKAAIRPLLEHRREEATLRRQELYREFSGYAGYKPGESAYDFLARHKVGPGEVDPMLMPYYLLLVGSPETIPFEFQYQLDIQYAVGRIHFDTLDEYHRYAESVVNAEKETEESTGRSQRVALFTPQYEETGTSIQTQVCKELAKPLVQRLETNKPNWVFTSISGDDATKSRLNKLLGGDEKPALFFIGSHGASFPKDHPRLLADQGGPICQGWRESDLSSTGPSPEFYFSADDLAETAKLFGLIVFAFVAYGAGTPESDDFYRNRQAVQPKYTIGRPFLARLPQRMLSHPHGSALAFIGHVAETWMSSFLMRQAGAGTGVQTYAAVIERLIEGYPVGAALEPFNLRYAELAASWLDILNQDQAKLMALLSRLFDRVKQEVASSSTRPDQVKREIVSNQAQFMASLSKLLDRVKQEIVSNQAQLVASLSALIEQIKQNRSFIQDKIEESSFNEIELKALLSGQDELVELLSDLLDQVYQRKPIDQGERSKIAIDARNWIVIGDPAVRLMVSNLRPDIKILQQSYAVEKLREEGDTLARKGDMAGAEAKYQNALNISPWLGFDPSIEARLVASREQVREAKVLAMEGEIEPALEHFEKARELNPGLDSEVVQDLYRLAVLFWLTEGRKKAYQGDYQGALESLNRAAKLDSSINPFAEADPRIASYFRNQGRSFAQKGNLDEAIKWYQESKKFDPTIGSELNPSNRLDPEEEARKYAAPFFEAQGKQVRD